MSLYLQDGSITELSFEEKGWLIITYFNHHTKRMKLPRGGLIKLDCSHHRLTKLENLPEELEVLDCAYNKLTRLENLPKRLKKLHCSHNQLTLLENLPKRLEVLDCSANELTKLENLPKSLEQLDCSENWLTELEHLPRGLGVLICFFNPLKYIVPLPDRPDYYHCPEHLGRLHNPENYAGYYEEYVVYSSRREELLADLRLEENCDDPILDDLDFWISEIWVSR